MSLRGADILDHGLASGRKMKYEIQTMHSLGGSVWETRDVVIDAYDDALCFPSFRVDDGLCVRLIDEIGVTSYQGFYRDGQFVHLDPMVGDWNFNNESQRFCANIGCVDAWLTCPNVLWLTFACAYTLREQISVLLCDLAIGWTNEWRENQFLSRLKMMRHHFVHNKTHSLAYVAQDWRVQQTGMGRVIRSISEDTQLSRVYAMAWFCEITKNGTPDLTHYTPVAEMLGTYPDEAREHRQQELVHHFRYKISLFDYLMSLS